MLEITPVRMEFPVEANILLAKQISSEMPLIAESFVCLFL